MNLYENKSIQANGEDIIKNASVKIVSPKMHRTSNLIPKILQRKTLIWCTVLFMGHQKGSWPNITNKQKESVVVQRF